MEMSLKGKRALVCGSSQGIGLAAAVELAALGAECVLLARNEQRLEEALKQLKRRAGVSHSYLVADFKEPGQVHSVVDALVQQKVVHILVNNTGGPSAGPIVEAGADSFLEACAQHLVCNQLLTQAVLSGMREVAYGRIINILSTSVRTPLPNLGVSNTARWAVAAWAKTLAGEVASEGITVNNVLPGSTQTARLDSIFETAAAQRETKRETIEKEWLSKIPMGRFAQASEIGAMVAFLASPAASYVTGTSIAVDGGLTPAM